MIESVTKSDLESTIKLGNWEPRTYDMQVDQRSRVRQITFLVPSTEELTRRRRVWYTDRKTTELIWCWPEVNRKLLNSFEYTSNSLEFSWIHFESFGITWNYWNFSEFFGIGLNLKNKLLNYFEFRCLKKINNLWNLWIILESIRKFWNHLKSFQFGQSWNQTA